MEFVSSFINHLHTRAQQKNARDYMKGLLSDTERKNVESISYFHGYDRQRLQIFIGQSDWNDEAILDKLVKQIGKQIGEEGGVLILDPTSFPKKGKESVAIEGIAATSMVRTTREERKLSSGHIFGVCK